MKQMSNETTKIWNDGLVWGVGHTGGNPLGKKRRRCKDRKNEEWERKEGFGGIYPDAGSVVHGIACQVNVRDGRRTL